MGVHYEKNPRRDKHIFDLMDKGVSAEKTKKALELDISRQRIHKIYLIEKEKAEKLSTVK